MTSLTNSYTLSENLSNLLQNQLQATPGTADGVAATLAEYLQQEADNDFCDYIFTVTNMETSVGTVCG